MPMIKYTKGSWDYRLYEDYFHVCQCIPPITHIVGTIDHSHIKMTGNLLSILEGYAWNGPSGPTIHTKNFMRGSLVHDSLYQLIEEGYLPRSFRKPADKELKHILLEDGMSKIRTWYVYRAVRKFGNLAIIKQPKVYTAP